MSLQSKKAIPPSIPNGMVLLMLCKVGLRRQLRTTSEKMVNTSHSDEEKRIQDKESKEETILAMLGIIGTILNLVVIIFVYIYTTL
ncbi:protein TUNAR [Clarias gariepinus]|uniref:protein TUNAR-like n=1 Tax=Clarias gariepinus TaxID=13013 RepID=UPI00234E204C|nr:protein TUNAR-like [Clarias gariepinus]